ncbi:hypothetical protein RD792_010898, partial [Penstemon davidsonii]
EKEENGSLECMELPSENLRPRLTHLPRMWKSAWDNSEVCSDVLQTMLPQ